jgi:hypothetical protein
MVFKPFKNAKESTYGGRSGERICIKKGRDDSALRSIYTVDQAIFSST